MKRLLKALVVIKPEIGLVVMVALITFTTRIFCNEARVKESQKITWHEKDDGVGYGDTRYFEWPENFGATLQQYLLRHPEVEVVTYSGYSQGGNTIGYYVTFRKTSNTTAAQK